MAKHFDLLADETHQIEHAIAEELAGDRTTIPRNITRLQRLDFLRQSLEDMALLTLILSKHTQGELPNDMAQKLRLEATRTVFRSAITPTAPVQADEAAGDVDLF
ncbi:MAG: hypothetical protein AB8B60_06270 [Sulfitobacter sp.]